MNRTLLLILCDFLLLNLLALTRWEQAEPTRPEQRPSVRVGGDGEQTTPQEDVADVMRLSLEDERAAREALEQRLGETQAQLQERAQTAEQLKARSTELATTLSETRETAEELRQRVEQAARDAATSRERMEQLQRDLEQREAEAARQQQQLAELEKQRVEAQQRIQQLDVAVRVAEQEKSILRETADTYREQAEIERQQRIKVQESTTQLAQGVGQLAEKSAEITREIRENRPINANTLFSEFLGNRVPSTIRAQRPGFFGQVDREASAQTILVTDGQSTYAVLHIEDTPFTLYDPYTDWTRIEATLRGGAGGGVSVPEILFLSVDPRVIALPLTPEQVTALGRKVYQTALDPFKFPEAVLISNGGQGYGEVPFKLDPNNPSYVRMDNRLVRRLFGDFSPSRGDLVLSKTGELLGVMVTSDVCALVGHFEPFRRIPTGELGSRRTSEIFGDIARRVGVGVSRVSPPRR